MILGYISYRDVSLVILKVKPGSAVLLAMFNCTFVAMNWNSVNICLVQLITVHNTGGCTMMAMVTQFVCRPLICSAGKLLNCDHRNHPPS